MNMPPLTRCRACSRNTSASSARPPNGSRTSAAQVAAIADSIAAQRRSIQALQTQLSAFDEQLAVLEQLLGPLAQWSKTWADLERRILDLGLWPGTGD